MAKQTTIATATSKITTKKASAASKGVGKERKSTAGRQNEAAKARKRKETAKGKRSLLKQTDNEGSADHRSGIRTPNKAPRPENLFNDELKSYDLEYEAEKILDSKIEKKKRHYLIKWVGWPESASTWEPEVNLRNALDLIAEFDNDNPTKP